MLACFLSFCMAKITFNEETKVFSIDTEGSTYQMKIAEYNSLVHLYYGKSIKDADLSYLHRLAVRSFDPYPYESDSSFSFNAVLQEYPSFGVGDFRTSCLSVVNGDGSSAADLRYVSHKIYKGKPKLDGLPSVRAPEADVLDITMKDKTTGLQVILRYSCVEEYDAITRSAIINNTTPSKIYLTRALSACVDFHESDFELTTLYGRYGSERNVQRSPLQRGRLSVDSVRGSSSHMQNPFAILSKPTTDEKSGEAYGVHFVYSGNFLIEAEVDQYEQTRLVAGISPQFFNYELEKGESFVTPEVIFTYSDQGIGGLTKKSHRLLRNNLINPKWANKRRPILINSWEANYFSITDEKMINLAKASSELGIEMLVMDDGWFGHRGDDHSSLGDWYVNKNKIKDLKKLVETVNSFGMDFGIWFEPEMVNEDSDLYRAHPDWHLHIPGRPPAMGRNQLVLDFSRKDVVDNIYQQMYNILSSANISYVKWDMNRNLCDVWSALLSNTQQGRLYHLYVLGVYDLLERLLQAFPNLMIEGCSGGGGRFDAGMLYYTPQIWASDDTDPIERLLIQFGTSLAYPVNSIGAHVSASPCHQTGRATSLNTRGVVAMFGTFGYELDITSLDQKTKDEIASQVAKFKRIYDTIEFGDHYRLVSPFENDYYCAWMMVSPDKNKAVVSFVQIHVHPSPPFIRIRLQGLDPSKIYKVTEDGKVNRYSGSALMNAGFNCPMSANGDYESWQFEFEAEN